MFVYRNYIAIVCKWGFAFFFYTGCVCELTV